MDAYHIREITLHPGAFTEVSVSGCKEINPLENYPGWRFIGTGTRVLLNGGTGYVIGEGTRSNQEKPNLLVYGNMKGMDPLMMGGFFTSAGDRLSGPERSVGLYPLREVQCSCPIPPAMGVACPRNLWIFCQDNGAFGSTDNQPTYAATGWILN